MATNAKKYPIPQTGGAKELTPQEKLFVEAYTGNAQDAARMAGYATEHYGYRLMRNPKIREALRERNANIDSAFNEERRDVIMGRDEILRELTIIARGGETSTADKLKAIDMLGKAIGLWISKVEVTTMTYEERLRQILQQEAAEVAMEFGDV